MGAPDHLAGMSEELEAPAYSTGVGILLYGFRQEISAEKTALSQVRGTGNNGGGGLLDRIKRIFNF